MKTEKNTVREPENAQRDMLDLAIEKLAIIGMLAVIAHFIIGLSLLY